MKNQPKSCYFLSEIFSFLKEKHPNINLQKHHFSLAISHGITKKWYLLKCPPVEDLQINLKELEKEFKENKNFNSYYEWISYEILSEFGEQGKTIVILDDF
jgi:hypothetical protein